MDRRSTRSRRSSSRWTRRFGIDWTLEAVGRPVRMLVIVFDPAHCMIDLLYRKRSGTADGVVAGVSNHPRCARRRALRHPVPPLPVTPRPRRRPRRGSGAGRGAGLELIVLARYMQILSDECRRWRAGASTSTTRSCRGSRARGLPAGPRARREADRRDGALRHGRPRRGADHRAGRRARRPLAGTSRTSSRSGATSSAVPWRARCVAPGAPGPARRAPAVRAPLSLPETLRCLTLRRRQWGMLPGTIPTAALKPSDALSPEDPR